MFLRKLKNRSGSTSVQIISKAHGKYKVLQTIGNGHNEQEVQRLWYLGKKEIDRRVARQKFSFLNRLQIVEQAMESLANASIRTDGHQIIQKNY